MKITKRKDGRWQRRVTLSDGSSKYFYSSEPTERKAEKDIEKQILEFDRKQHSEKHNFGYIAKKFLQQKESDVSHSTYMTYFYTLKYLEVFNDDDIESITPSQLKKLFDKLARQGYSMSALNKTKTTFGLVMNYAIVELDLPVTNFARDVKIPKLTPKSKVSAPDDKTISAIIRSAEPVSFGMWAMILLCTGMRRGELVALQRKDIDFEKNEINIWRSAEFISNQAQLKSMPKTTNSIRTVPILDMLSESLQNLCQNMKPTDFVFGSDKPLSATAVNKRWKKYCREVGIDVHMHQLRHAYAKLLYRAGVDAKTAQGLLGHSNINITMDIYTDFSEEMNVKSATKVNALLSDLFAV